MAVAGVWLAARMERHNAAPGQHTPSWNVTHEKAFLTEQLRRSPGHPPILLRLAQIERSEGDLAGARDYLRQAVMADSKEIEARLELGLVCSEMGDLACAEEQNRAVLSQVPGQADALYNLGAIFANRGDFAGARKAWTDAVRRGEPAEAVAKAREALERLSQMR
jgi:tetratricopeptide (TPR) repeat protein